MPRLSYFYGLSIAMNYNDHAQPHFHVVYGEHDASVGINPIRVLVGSLPSRAHSLVFEWAALHQEELLENWNRAREQRSLRAIAPLD